jgi:hypothetical protein
MTTRSWIRRPFALPTRKAPGRRRQLRFGARAASHIKETSP